MRLYKLTFLLAVLPAVIALQTASAGEPDSVANAPAVLETKMALRDLWVEHVFWIRNYVLATRDGDNAEGDVAEAQVVANAKALAGTIEPFYGDAASKQLFSLLAGHWGAVKAYNTARFGNSASDQNHATEKLTANAREIAKFLSGANPYLPEDAVFGLLAAHGIHHVSQINQIEEGAFDKEAETWADMRLHMLVISDAIAEALGKQFPKQFVAQN